MPGFGGMGRKSPTEKVDKRKIKTEAVLVVPPFPYESKIGAPTVFRLVTETSRTFPKGWVSRISGEKTGGKVGWESNIFPR